MTEYPAEPDDVILQRIEVSFEYPVYFTHRLFSPENPLLASFFTRHTIRRTKVMVCIDDGVHRAWPVLCDDVARYFESRPEIVDLTGPPIILHGGESAKKGWATVQSIMARAAEAGMCRHSYLIAIGGGSILDMAGFAASLIHRGVRHLRIPTTVLSQCDGGVGVKTGMDEFGIKNFAGTFSPPAGVINDFDFLATLPDPYWYGGISEAFKVAIIRDRCFFDQLAARAASLRKRDAGAIEPVIRKAARLHLDHIRDGGDPFEFGSARPLDFGHWAAHKLETLSGYRIGHGQAVALGMAIDTCYAARKGFLRDTERDLILATMRDAGLPLWSPLLLQQNAHGDADILAGLAEFQQHLGGELTITLPEGIGHTVEVHSMDRDDLMNAIRFLHQNYDGNTP